MKFARHWRHAARFLPIVALMAMSGCTSAATGPSETSGVSSDALAIASNASSPAADGELRVVDELPAPSNTGGGADQPLSANDVIEVDVFQVDDLDRTVQIDSSGQISLPLVGAVAAAGKTVRVLEQELEGRYGANYLQAPEITIFVKESSGQRVTVDGEVVKAGIYPVSSRSTLLEVIAVAGGFREVADATKVYVFRDIDGAKVVAHYDVNAIRGGKRGDPRIYGGDVIVIFPSKGKMAVRNLKEALGLASGAARLAVIP